MTNQTPLNPDAIESAAKALLAVQQPEVSADYAWNVQFEDGRDELRNEARAAVSAYRTAAHQILSSVKYLPNNTVIEDSSGDVGIIFNNQIWYPECNPMDAEHADKRYGPFTIRYAPEVKL